MFLICVKCNGVNWWWEYVVTAHHQPSGWPWSVHTTANRDSCGPYPSIRCLVGWLVDRRHQRPWPKGTAALLHGIHKKTDWLWRSRQALYRLSRPSECTHWSWLIDFWQSQKNLTDQAYKSADWLAARNPLGTTFPFILKCWRKCCNSSKTEWNWEWGLINKVNRGINQIGACQLITNQHEAMMTVSVTRGRCWVSVTTKK